MGARARGRIGVVLMRDGHNNASDVQSNAVIATALSRAMVIVCLRNQTTMREQLKPPQ
ncbi:hypothetical protein J6590_000097 [Homalodisca vitripennis]|nr:hypothetical protein J6590_000097 [Homalodisca vitripennis]